MRKLLLLTILLTVNLPIVYGQQRSVAPRSRGVAVAFFDEERLRDAAGRARRESFEHFLKLIQPMAKRDFPDVEFKILGRGKLLRLPDGTGLNVQNLQPDLGFVLSAPGKKRRILTGPQTEADFACAAAVFFRRKSSACPK
jgi:hypothetical protein